MRSAATGVEYVKGNEVFFQPAQVVLIASYAYENVRLRCIKVFGFSQRTCK